MFDEPEAGIDIWSFSNLIEVFRSLRRNLNGSLVIISHQERILRIADEIAVVADGVITQYGPAAEMMTKLMGDSISTLCAKQEASLNE